MNYRHITQDDQDDYVAEAQRAREHEHWQYEVNIRNYERAVAELPRGDAFRKRLEDLLVSERAAQSQVETIHAALGGHFEGDAARLEAAHRRVAEKAARELASAEPAQKG